MQNGKAACGTGAGIRKLLVREGRPNPVRDGLAVLLSLVSPPPWPPRLHRLHRERAAPPPGPRVWQESVPRDSSPHRLLQESVWPHVLLDPAPPPPRMWGGGRACNMQVASRQRVRPARGLGWSQPRSPALSRAGASSREIQSRPSGARGGAVHLDSRPRLLQSPHVPCSNGVQKTRPSNPHGPFSLGTRWSTAPPHAPSGL